MKIGLAQINTIVGDLEGNRKKILQAYSKLSKQGAEVVVFPELAICGYPPRDLVFKSDFTKDNEESLHAIAKTIAKVPALIGFVGQSPPKAPVQRFFNAAAWCHQGKIQHITHKCLLPSYDVFEEKRYFRPGNEPLVITYKNKRIALTICEDIWTGEFLKAFRQIPCDPVKIIAETNVDLIINISASPWNYGKTQTRQNLLGSVAKRCNSPIVYCNQVGGNDQLIFDGRSLIFTAEGQPHTILPAFQEALHVADLSLPPTPPPKQLSETDKIYQALTLGLRDYAHKCGFKKALIGLSGGIDSAIVAVLAAEALGSENVIGISLPSKISSDHSKTDARNLATNLGLEFHTLPIATIVEATEETLAPLFKGYSRDVTEENIQARTRGQLLMALSNKFGILLLSTGNKSEQAVGYCTLYGDMAGGLAVISDLTKTKVYELAHFINHKKEIIPKNTITKEPSAELSPDQKDEDSLPPYDVLDQIVCLYIENHFSAEKIIAQGFDPTIVRNIIHKIDINEYKRQQAPPGLRITPLAFGMGRRMPIVQKYPN